MNVSIEHINRLFIYKVGEQVFFPRLVGNHFIAFLNF